MGIEKQDSGEILLNGKDITEYKVEELRFKPRRKKKDVKLTKEEMAELRALEERNGASKLDDN